MNPTAIATSHDEKASAPGSAVLEIAGDKRPVVITSDPSGPAPKPFTLARRLQRRSEYPSRAPADLVATTSKPRKP
jgi:hypothetical protein